MNIIAHHGKKKHQKGDILPQLIFSSKQKVLALELDIQYTKDNAIIVYHNKILPSGLPIKDTNLKKIQSELPHILTLNEVFKVLPTTPLFIESKTTGTIAKSLNLLKKRQNYAVASFCKDEILATKIHLPHINTFLLQHYHPFGLIKGAIKVHANGIGYNKNWLFLLPYYYWQCKRKKLRIYVYTINTPWISKLIIKFMPQVIICTDNPQDILNTNEK